MFTWFHLLSQPRPHPRSRHLLKSAPLPCLKWTRDVKAHYRRILHVLISVSLIKDFDSSIITNAEVTMMSVFLSQQRAGESAVLPGSVACCYHSCSVPRHSPSLSCFYSAPSRPKGGNEPITSSLPSDGQFQLAKSQTVSMEPQNHTQRQMCTTTETTVCEQAHKKKTNAYITSAKTSLCKPQRQNIFLKHLYCKNNN